MIPSGEIFSLLMILWLHNLNSVVEMDTLEKVSLFDQEQSPNHLRKISQFLHPPSYTHPKPNFMDPNVISRDAFYDSEKIILTVPKSNVIRWSWISMFAQLDSVVNHDSLQLLVHVVGILTCCPCPDVPLSPCPLSPDEPQSKQLTRILSLV